MIREALEFLTDLGKAAAAPKKLIEDSGPTEAVYLVNGQVVRVPLLPGPRRHAPGTLADLIALANRFGEADSAEHVGAPVVWYDDRQVVLVIDDGAHRAATATLKLETSDVFATLEGLAKSKPWMDHKPFVRMLRIDLAGALEPGILERARSLIFESDSKASSVVTRDKESLGRSISASVRAAGGELPEEVDLHVPVYKTAGESRQRYAIRCAIDADHEQCRLRLFPLPDEVERVRQLAVESIGERLGEGLDDGVNFYQGKP